MTVARMVGKMDVSWAGEKVDPTGCLMVALSDILRDFLTAVHWVYTTVEAKAVRWARAKAHSWVAM